MANTIRDTSQHDKNLKKNTRHVTYGPKSPKSDFSWEIRDCGPRDTSFLPDFRVFEKNPRNQFWEINYWRDTLKMCRVRCRVCRGSVAQKIRGRGCRAMPETESPEPVVRPRYPVFPDRTSIRGDTVVQRAKQNPWFSAPERLRQLSPTISSTSISGRFQRFSTHTEWAKSKCANRPPPLRQDLKQPPAYT